MLRPVLCLRLGVGCGIVEVEIECVFGRSARHTFLGKRG